LAYIDTIIADKVKLQYPYLVAAALFQQQAHAASSQQVDSLYDPTAVGFLG
jgi:hypothetical protein